MKIFLISSPRSGSHHMLEYVHRSLDPDLDDKVLKINRARFEPLNKVWHRKIGKSPETGTAGIVKFIEEENRDISIIQMGQFKQWKTNVFEFANHFKDAKFIIINRENKFNQYLSELLASSEGKYFVKEYESKVEFVKKKYLEYVRNNISNFNEILFQLEMSSASYITVNYLDSSYSESDFRKVSKYIGGEYFDIYAGESHFKKQMKNNPIDYISNPEILTDLLKIKYSI